MKITSVYLENFRNYESLTLSDFGNANVLIGNNATGKTNLLESLYLGALGRSARLPRDKELITFGKNYAYVKLCVQKRLTKHTVEIYIDERGKKRIALDHSPIAKLSELIGALNVIYFSPDELRLVKDSPDLRRRFLDVSLCQQSRRYFVALSSLNKLVLQRNKLLKDAAFDKKLIQTIPDWDAEFARYNGEVVAERLQYVERLNTAATTIHSGLTGGAETLAVKYDKNVLGDTSEDISRETLIKLAHNLERDLYNGYTSVGAHRDDLSISVNGLDVKRFGSQGQQRTTVLSLKLSEIELFKVKTGETPVLLLDDVLSELDDSRTSELIRRSDTSQVFVTCTRYDVCDGKQEIRTRQFNSLDGAITLSVRE